MHESMDTTNTHENRFGVVCKAIKINPTISKLVKKYIYISFTNPLFVDHLTSEYILVVGSTLPIDTVYFILGSFSLLKRPFSG